MYCRKCGTSNDDNAYKCIACGEILQAASSASSTQDVPNYLIQAIVATVLCCVPLGIVAIVYASQVKTKLQAGDVAGAIDSSKKARTWSWLAFGLGAAAVGIYLVLLFSGVIGALRD